MNLQDIAVGETLEFFLSNGGWARPVWMAGRVLRTTPKTVVFETPVGNRKAAIENVRRPKTPLDLILGAADAPFGTAPTLWHPDHGYLMRDGTLTTKGARVLSKRKRKKE